MQTVKNGDHEILYAKWTAGSYTIVFKGNGSTSGSMSSQKATYDADVTLTANAFKKTNYAFTGWNTKSDGSETAYPNRASVQNLTTSGTVYLYAQWASLYTIKFDGNGSTSGSMSSMTSRRYGTDYTLKANAFSRKGYTFTGWNRKADGTGTSYANEATVRNLSSKAGGSVTLYAQWRANTYTIRFDGNGSTSGSMEDQSTRYNKTTTLTANGYYRRGYKFTGWNTKADGSGTSYDNKASVKNLRTSGSITLYAQWKKVKYSITYKLDGGTNSSSNPTSFYVTSSTKILKNATKKGYTFKGWYNSSGEKVTEIPKGSTGSRTLTAHWTKTWYTIVYNLNGGTNNSSNPTGFYITSATKTLKNPTRPGYTFKGWYKESTYKTKVTEIPKGSTGSRTLYAKWAANSYTIKFSGNGSTSGSMASISAKYGTTYTLKANAYRKTGYVFAGWNTVANPTEENPGTLYEDMASVKNLKTSGTVYLYAQWKLPDA